MIRIAGHKFDGIINYIQGGQYAELELMIPPDNGFSSADLDAIKNASMLEDISMDRGRQADVVGRYALYGWRRIEKQWNGGVLIAFQTNRETDVDALNAAVEQLKSENEALKKENEEKDEALLELASIISELTAKE